MSDAGDGRLCARAPQGVQGSTPGGVAYDAPVGQSDLAITGVVMLWLGLSSGVILGQLHVFAHEAAHC